MAPTDPVPAAAIDEILGLLSEPEDDLLRDRRAEP